MKKSKILIFIPVILFGIFMFVYGGYDDSPGAQLIGLLMVVISVALMIRGRKKSNP